MFNYVRAASYEESMVKQQFRVQWMDLRDSSSLSSHNSLKDRRSRNNNLILTARCGDLLEDDTSTQEGVRFVYFHYWGFL